mgnify:CR=1 FL=1
MKQQTLAMAADQTFENYRKPTRRDEILKTMEAIAPWSAMCKVIEPHYPKAGNGCRSLQKNATRAFTAFALANIYLGRQRLMAQVRP